MTIPPRPDPSANCLPQSSPFTDAEMAEQDAESAVFIEQAIKKLNATAPLVEQMRKMWVDRFNRRMACAGFANDKLSHDTLYEELRQLRDIGSALIVAADQRAEDAEATRLQHRKEADATLWKLTQERDEARAAGSTATDLLKRAMLKGCLGDWKSDAERDAWCSDYRDFQAGRYAQQRETEAK